MDDAELVRQLRNMNEYEPLGHDGWKAADRIEALVAERDAARDATPAFTAPAPAVQALVEAAREVYRISERDHVAWRKLSEALAAFDKT